jgi:hypothetical protein
MKSMATIQVPELLIYKKDTIELFDYPLQQKTYLDYTNFRFYLSVEGKPIGKNLMQADVVLFSSNCWRNYQGIWEIQNDSLFLMHLGPCPFAEKTVTEHDHLLRLYDLSLKFDNYDPKKGVHANWYFGILKTKFFELTSKTYKRSLFFIFKGRIFRMFITHRPREISLCSRKFREICWRVKNQHLR